MIQAGQEILRTDESYAQLDAWIKDTGKKSVFLVCGRSIRLLPKYRYFMEMPGRIGLKVVRFSNFSPNPTEESVREGIELFQREKCGMILAVGGGSAIDVAKCIRLYAGRDSIPFAVLPTTAGSGSEATKFAVIYRDGEKQSIADDGCLPDAVLFDPENLRHLPDYQRKASMMDAFCHAVESFWSVRATQESKMYAGQALRLIVQHFESYLDKDEAASKDMMLAAYLAGKAINITQTTAGHAMCYKLTGLYGIAHGHAAALCICELWPYMLAHMNNCVDERGSGYLERVFEEIAQAMGCDSSMGAALKFQEMFQSLKLGVPQAKDGDLLVLKTTVHPDRLKNHPVRLDVEELEALYRQILYSSM